MGELARREFLSGAAAIGLTACAANDPIAIAAQAKGTSGVSSDLLNQFAEQILAEYPENATSLGIDTGARAMLKHRAYADLQHAGVRGEEAAEHLREVMERGST